MGEVKRAVEALDVVEVALGESIGLLLAEDALELPDPGPWVALLPALDVTPMAYVQREWFLGPHASALFDRSGELDDGEIDTDQFRQWQVQEVEHSEACNHPLVQKAVVQLVAVING